MHESWMALLLQVNPKVQFMRESPEAITVINGKDLQGRSVFFGDHLR